MADYTQLGAFATGAASSLNGELIQKLYDAETKSLVKPLESKLELWDKEEEKILEINTKVNELLDAIKPFDLFASGNNAFEQISATTTGESAIFDAADVGALKAGTINISITQLAQKDAYQSVKFTSATDLIAGGQDAGDKITINGTDYSTEGKTYEDLLSDINLPGTVDASIEQVSDTEFRLLIKSKEPGTANNLAITQTGVDLGLEDVANHVLTAQNLNATADGVLYDVSSNSITLDGNLKITASKIGDASISVQKDDSAIVPAVEDFAKKYNELVILINEEVYSDEPSSQDKSSLKSILSDIKNTMYEKFGTGDESLFNFGLSFDKTGQMEVDAAILGKALTDDIDKVKDLFLGVAEDKGFGTLLKEQLDSLNSYNGLFSTYTENMLSRKVKLETEKEDTIKDLDTKYNAMAAQFSAYASIISKMESSFSGLKQMIAMETASN